MSKTKEQLENDFIASGERDRIKEVLLLKLRSEGWVDEVKELIQKEIKQQGIKEVTVEGLYDKFKQPARRLVSNSAKQELFQLVRHWVAQETGIQDLLS